MAAGLQATVSLTEVDSSDDEEEPESVDAKLAKLADMQFPITRAVRALEEAGGNLELALEVLLSQASDSLESGDKETQEAGAGSDACAETQVDSQGEEAESGVVRSKNSFGHTYFMLQAGVFCAEPCEYDSQPVEDQPEVNQASILDDLRRIPDKYWKTTSRKNVAPDGVKETHQLTLGLTDPRGHSQGFPMPSRATWTFRNLTCRLLRWHSDSVKDDPALKVTSIQVTKNLQSRPHVDRGNQGPSDLIALGDFTGGETWTEEESAAGSHVVQEPVKGRYKVGDIVKGRPLAVHNKWKRIDGNKLHFTQPFDGERYCIIFFAMKRQPQVVPVVRVFLERMGFGFVELMDQALPPREDLAIVDAALHRRPVDVDGEVRLQVGDLASPHSELAGRGEPRLSSSLTPKASRRAVRKNRNRQRQIRREWSRQLIGHWHLEDRESGDRHFEICKQGGRSERVLFRDTTKAEHVLEGSLRSFASGAASAAWTAKLRSAKFGEVPSYGGGNAPEKSGKKETQEWLGTLQLQLRRDSQRLQIKEHIYKPPDGSDPWTCSGFASKDAAAGGRRHVRYMRLSRALRSREVLDLAADDLGIPGPSTSSSSTAPPRTQSLDLTAQPPDPPPGQVPVSASTPPTAMSGCVAFHDEAPMEAPTPQVMSPPPDSQPTQATSVPPTRRRSLLVCCPDCGLRRIPAWPLMPVRQTRKRKAGTVQKARKAARIPASLPIVLCAPRPFEPQPPPEPGLSPGGSQGSGLPLSQASVRSQASHAEAKDPWSGPLADCFRRSGEAETKRAAAAPQWASPRVVEADAGAGPEQPSEGPVACLVSMGFAREAAAEALQHTRGSMEEAVARLVNMEACT